MSDIGLSVTSKKCAACSYWGGQRSIRFTGNKPYMVMADNGFHECIAQKGRKVPPSQTCSRWRLWEKLG